MVLNATNSKIVKSFANGSAFVEDWKDIPVQLYIAPEVKMAGEVVGGIRVNIQQPRLTKPELTPSNEKQWNRAIEAYQRDGNLDAVLAHVQISKKNQDGIIEAANVSQH